MKRILLIAVLLGTMITATTYFVCIAAPSVLFGKGIKGSGNIVTRTIDAPDFDRVDAARAVKVVITGKATGKITIEADDNIMEYVVVEAKGGRLTATIDKSVNNVSNADVTVTVPANGRIRALDASSAARITSDVTLTADKFSIDASSAARIDAAVKSTSCTVAASSASNIDAAIETGSCTVGASSASKITLKGSADKCSIDMSSAAKLSAAEFTVADCSVDTSSAAKATVKCSISGVAFTMDADAYQELENYLDSLKKTYKDTPDGAEIVADIEARIAELILTTQDNTRVVEKPLILNIIHQMGSVEDISEESSDKKAPEEPRIPRRLYRDTENAKLGGVCAGIGKYFDVDPVWIRLGMFLPILLSFLHWIPFMDWTGSMMGNLFGIFVICYVIMWFAVPAARTARQKLEMNGEKITAQSIRETTEATAGCDPDVRAKPIVAEAVSVFGKVVLILLKLFAGLLVFGLIMGACALIIGLFALVVGGGGILSPFFPLGMTLWVPILGIFIVLIPVILLIYVLMCLIASRKPGGTTVLVIFLLWLASFIACACIAIREDVGDRFRAKRNVIEQVLNTEVVIDNDTTTVQKLLKEYESQNVIEDGHKTLHISIPNKSIDITIDKDKAGLEVKADGKRVKVGKSRKASAEEAGQSTQAAAEADADTAAQEQQTE